ncbi:uncharacterized protein [Physcomitrium patens]|uniref:Uncharacterized protein n=1 Tax=Physcomitrium patens TaxID=3218 RepID=A0A2K1JD88_PHYPA|nr:disease resistance protein TAO1-like [Physcomitrium patens]XP_024397253.1 disease resistance protein TAO1-like [Physcomitrium patens]XP_024397254.1 disease resistance protein TAO1-like [Physcomitrium patens]XP_024397255.1 disease resistance protein TAO1-like [Physcomitrium patens]XP_024397256.1 disease resistance protein TAO1-like [Physcomitrium patens]XP_024397257.1 disease resistance protein TAO1-like [Physcomitrium patens]PNR39495.1 hypothetical protein PHYPA_019773 [Physcomitrium paten|eukprot:XP_024397252.1 disease resistance protein TAO1-like [Physcomitrella patens]
MGKQTEQSPPEAKNLLSNQKSPRSPKYGPKSVFKLDRFESPRGSLTKSNDSPRLSVAFSSSSANNISPNGAKQASTVSKQLDFSSPGSVSSKNGTKTSPKCAAPRLVLDTVNSASLNSSRRFSHNGPGDTESVADFPCSSITIDELRQIEQILQASSTRLEELYKKVSETLFKDHSAVFESLQWDILKETGYISWFELALTLAGFLSSHCIEEEGLVDKKSKWALLKSKSDCIFEQLDELKTNLESDSDIYKLAAGTLVYCCSVVRHLEQKSQKCGCFGPRSDVYFNEQIEKTTQELKGLQDNLNFATLAAVGNRVSQPIARSPRIVMRRPEQVPSIVGLEPHISHIAEYMKKNGVCLIGIYGQSGIGKTTLLNEIVSKVEASEKRLFAYIELNEDVRRLQSSLLLQLGGGRKEFSNSAQGRNAILYQLQKLKQQSKAVRIAIDNLYDVRLVGELFPHSLWKVLSNQSSVLITCSSLSILAKVDQLCRTAIPAYNYLPYKFPHMTAEHAKALFISYAASEPVKSLSSMNGVFAKYGDLAENFLPLCEGLPIAVKVVGSYFATPANRTEENCSTIIKRMKQAEEEMDTSEDQMCAKLMVIYEKLDLDQKEAFLDIAAFCRYWDWRTVERIVGKAQLDTLVDLGLVHAKLRDTDSFAGIAHLTRYSEHPWRTDMVMMHDLLYTIACRRTQGNRVHSEDQAHLPDRLLMDSPGSELSQIQGLSLISCKEALQGTMLEKMLNVRTIILHDVNIKGFCTKNLNQLQVFYWGKSQIARDVRIPFQLCKMRKLEMVILRATEIDLGIKFPSQLRDLTISGCNNMDELPETILVLTSLLELHLISCNKLQDLTIGFGSLKSLCRFRLENCLSIRQLPKAIGQLTNLQEMDLSGCTNITTLPSEIGNLLGLQKLNLSRCKCLIRVPVELGSLTKLTTFNLSQSGITTLPQEIGKLRNLESLFLFGCSRLEKLPKDIGKLSSLLQLHLGSCTSLKEIPREIGKLESLQKLSLNSCTSLVRLPEEVFHIVTLQALDLDHCKLLAHLSSEIRNLKSLQRLSLNCCTRLNRLPLEIASLPSLEVLNLVGCTGLKPELPKDLRKMTKENSVKVHRDDDLVILEGPKNPSFKLYSMAY